MGWFGKSEEELKKWQETLDRKEKDLTERQRVLNQKEEENRNLKKALSEKDTRLSRMDAEICQKQQTLDSKEIEARNNFVRQQREAFHEALEVRSKQLDLRAEELADLLESLETRMTAIVAKESEVSQRELDIKKRELASEGDTLEKNRKLLVEIEKREERCRQAERNLQENEVTFLQKLQEQEQKSEELRRREQSVQEAEFLRDAGFVKEQKKLDEELNARRQKVYEELDAKIQKVSDELDAQIKTVQDGLETKRQKELREMTEKRQKLDAEIEDERKQLEQKKFSMQSDLESEFVSRRERMEKEFADKNTSLEIAFLERQEALEKDFGVRKMSLSQELTGLREKGFPALEKELSKERALRLEALNNEINTARQEWEKQKKSEEAKISAEKQELSSMKAELDELLSEVEYTKKAMALKEKNLVERESSLNEELEKQLTERRKSMEIAEQSMRSEMERLRQSLKSEEDNFGIFDELKRKMGGKDPQELLFELDLKTEEIKNLRDELMERPAAEVRRLFDEQKQKYQQLIDENERLKEENREMKPKTLEWSQQEMKFRELKDELESLQNRNSIIVADNNFCRQQLQRLTSSYEDEQDTTGRIKEIEKPIIEIIPETYGKKDENVIKGEIEWLENIYSSCIDYGIAFPKRILYAFHTALKTAEWSPLTVLAGVSGTGKSELPKLYARFGGMNFLSLSVQPNWDSQEAMLGFFNSIDNHFDAQPVLRFLAQTQKKKSPDYPYGLNETVNIVLMDEMNLAHVELYFAEFLSKLELRRGMKNDSVPFLDVKLGTKEDHHYKLPMGRNVLWTGTMNQDETTKSLSDKVLDRGIVINFPRPRILQRRKELKPWKECDNFLYRKVWEEWWCREIYFTDEQIRPYKEFVEEMNNNLNRAGRALGHRVWQSIEYYMANYPLVKKNWQEDGGAEFDKAMKIAFEDQLVQKVMPKLRGIETRAGSTSRKECLDRIKAQLSDGGYSIIEDFESACEFGYGQFIWNSANYLLQDDIFGDGSDAGEKASE